MSRFWKHTNHCYSVENQNGLNNALYHYFGATDTGGFGVLSKKEVRAMLQNFPEYYPMTIVIVYQSFECSRVYIETMDIRDESHVLIFKGDKPYVNEPQK